MRGAAGTALLGGAAFCAVRAPDIWRFLIGSAHATCRKKLERVFVRKSPGRRVTDTQFKTFMNLVHPGAANASELMLSGVLNIKTFLIRA